MLVLAKMVIGLPESKWQDGKKNGKDVEQENNTAATSSSSSSSSIQHYPKQSTLSDFMTSKLTSCYSPTLISCTSSTLVSFGNN
jgi:hypothetical protein